MRKVDVSLLPELVAGAHEQEVGVYSLTANTPTTLCSGMTDSSWKKGHDVPEGLYMVELVGIKCHGPYAYKMEIQVLGDADSQNPFHEQKVIKGYGERNCKDFSDLALCFARGELRRRSVDYIGCQGVIYLSASGWISLMPRYLFDVEPPF